MKNRKKNLKKNPKNKKVVRITQSIRKISEHQKNQYLIRCERIFLHVNYFFLDDFIIFTKVSNSITATYCSKIDSISLFLTLQITPGFNDGQFMESVMAPIG